MRAPFWRAALSATLLAAAASAACDRQTETPTDPGTIVVETTETFSGTLTVNGGSTHSFDVTTAGSVTATVSELTPNRADFSLSIGIALGTWNGTSCALSGAPSLFNDNSGVGSGIAGVANAAGSFCVRVYDVGQLTEPVTYKLTVKHF